jgi:hypothetical protein
VDVRNQRRKPLKRCAGSNLADAGRIAVHAHRRWATPGPGEVAGREATRKVCGALVAMPRTTELPGDRPDFHISIAVDRETGVILRLIESIGGAVTRHAEVIELLPDVPLPAAAFYFVFPTGTTMLY